MEKRESCVFYNSWRKAISRLDPETQLMFIYAVFDYAMEFVEPELDESLLGYWDLIKPNIDANTKKWRNGRKGGRKPEPVVKLVVKPQSKVVSPNVNDNDNVNVNVNDNVNVSDSDKLKYASLANYHKFKKECLSNEAWVNGICHEFEKKKVTKGQIPNLIEEFATVQLNRFHKGWETKKAFSSHFTNWLNTKFNYAENNVNKGSPVKETPARLSKPKSFSFR